MNCKDLNIGDKVLIRWVDNETDVGEILGFNVIDGVERVLVYIEKYSSTNGYNVSASKIEKKITNEEYEQIVILDNL